MIRKPRYPGEGLSLSWLLILVFCSHLVFLISCRERSGQTVPVRTETRAVKTDGQAGFVKRDLCIECHKEQYLEWYGSRHDLSMDIAGSESVKGNFNDVQFTHQEVTFHFFRKGGRYFVQIDEPVSGPFDYEIAYVLGVSPLQRYMIEFPDGRIEIPPVAWDNRAVVRGGQRWVYIPPDRHGGLSGSGGGTGRFINWNSMCGECHTTNFRKNYDLKTDSFRTAWSMMDIGCQGCHGPGSNHVLWARTADGEEMKDTANGTMGLEVDLGAGNASVQVEACARCHSGRVELGETYKYGRPLMDFYVPYVLTTPWYYPDGQIRDEVYEYGSYIQSKKYGRDIRCTECHDPHTARLWTYGNELCIDCHSTPPAPQFSYLRDADYASPLHHFHKENSPGAQCIECHMPSETYMVTGRLHDHSFQVPRPDLSVRFNIPNACNRCHADKSPEWAAEKIYEVHPLSRKKHEREVQIAEVFSSAQQNRPEAEPGLIRIAGDRSWSSIVRATALNLLTGYRSEKAAGMSAMTLMDEDPLVRYESVKAISAMIPKSSGAESQKRKYSLIAPLLRDPVRAVRVESARAAAEIPQEFHDEKNRSDFERALEEYKAQQESSAERPEAHLNLGILYENLGKDDLAAASYETAIGIAGDFYSARFLLADLYKRTGLKREAEQQYRQIIGLQPKEREAYHLLGMLLSEENRLDEAVSVLGKAVELMPGEADVRYDYALVLRHLGRNDEALTEMLYAHEIDRADPAVVQAIVNFYMQDGQWKSALYYAQLLVKLLPDAERPKHMLMQIQQAIKAGKDSIQ